MPISQSLVIARLDRAIHIFLFSPYADILAARLGTEGYLVLEGQPENFHSGGIADGRGEGAVRQKEKSRMTEDERIRVLAAISERGSDRWNTPSGAILALLTEFAKQDKLLQLSEAYRMYVKACPDAKPYVSERLSAIINNHYLLRFAELETIKRWMEKNPDVDEQIKAYAETPQLVGFISQIRIELEAM